MAVGKSTISVALLADASKFKRSMDEASSKLGKFGTKAGEVSRNVVRGFGLMTAAAGGLAVVAGKHLFDVGEELVSLDQKINTVFSGESLATVTDWADEVAARMGLTATQAAGLAANAGDLLKPMGFTADEAASMATEVVGLSGALSEWSGGQRSVEETAEILQKALLGERESLKSLGISINQAQVDTRALAVAQADGRDEITAMDKAVATQQLIMESATDAISAYEAGGNQLTMAQNRLRAAFGEIQETLARKLLPVFAKAADIVVELIEVFDDKGLGGVIELVVDRLKAAWPHIRRQLANWAREFVGWIRQVGPPFLRNMRDWLVDFANWFSEDGLDMIVTQLGRWARAFLEWIGPLIPPFLRNMAQLLLDIHVWLITVALPNLIEDLGEWAAAFIDWVVDVTPDVLSALGELLADLGRWFWNTGIPEFARFVDDLGHALIDWVADVTPDLLRAFRDLMLDLGEWIIDHGIPRLIQFGGQLAGGLIDGLGRMATGIFDAAVDLGQDLVNGIVDGIRSMPGAIADAIAALIPGGGIVRDVWNTIGGMHFGATGGIVTQPTLAMIGEAGPEAVVPLNQAPGASPLPIGGRFGGGGDTYVTVNMPAGASGDDVVRALQDYTRRRGAIPVPVGTARY